ncbi:MAG: 5-oxoprolinase subunit PxpA [Flavobacteriaceae bacterium]|nr:5-oxoprolinase subunit PxpA [Bacteroidia bacterium]NNL60049.1 5-oxoprolinase subunit PxpA [Flavobacteriaceae bacterium]
MASYTIDINCDVGEGIGNEESLMPYISSCNIACGGHAGNEKTMQETVKLAIKHKVKIGAHPSYPDRKNFGREEMEISCAALFRSMEDQISRLLKVLKKENGQLHHVKPHGALYNKAARNEKTARTIVEVMKRFHLALKLYVPYGSVIAEIAKQEDIPLIYEAFADRNYNHDLTLVSRKENNALITDPEEMLAHVLRMITNKKVRCLNGVEVKIEASTFCVHGDNPKAVKLISFLTNKSAMQNIRIN